MNSIDVIISKEDASAIKKYLGLSSKEAYDKYGLKRYERPVDIDIIFNKNYSGEIYIEVSDKDEDILTAEVTLLHRDDEDIVDGDTCYSLDELKNCILTDENGDKYGFIFMQEVQ